MRDRWMLTDLNAVNDSRPKRASRAYRRNMKRKKRQRRMKIMTYRYHPAAGYTDWDWIDGVFQPAGKYIKYPKNSNRQVYWKTCSNRAVRRHKGPLPKGNLYRRCFEYQYAID